MRPKTRVPDDSVVGMVAGLAELHGDTEAARRLDLHPRTVARVLARRPVYPSTLRRIRERLGEQP